MRQAERGVASSGAFPLYTGRTTLRAPSDQDAQAIFERYASDAEVTRLVGWPRHGSVTDSAAFVEFSRDEWRRWPAGPLLICDRNDGRVLGSAGLAFETPWRASTGYVLARDAWGRGLATEVLEAMTELAQRCGVLRLYALCFAGHAASARVLERCAFTLEGTLSRHSMFPNGGFDGPQDVRCYARTW